MYDVIIIGAGPAGMTAAIYTARKKLKTLLVSKQMGGQMVWSNDVENYTGFSMISGAELTLKFKEHLQHVTEDLEVREGVEVVNIERNITTFELQVKDGQTLYAKSVIIASGKEPRHLGIPGEDKFFGRGVAVCATCDAPLYKNKDVVVVGGGNSAMDALLALSKVARRIYSVNVNEHLRGDDVFRRKVEATPNITFYNSAKALGVVGDVQVTGLSIQKADGGLEFLNASGVFVEIGYMPSNSFDKLTDKNEMGEVKVDQNLQSSVPGLFAAGDINNAWGEQIIIAAGEGAKAAIAAANYLNGLK